MKEKIMKENGKIIKCPKCNSTDIEAVMPFDYVKVCKNDNCKYFLQHPEKFRYQFSTGCHN